MGVGVARQLLAAGPGVRVSDGAGTTGLVNALTGADRPPLRLLTIAVTAARQGREREGLDI